MEPISIIVTALALGAAAGLKPLAEQAVKDAYDGLKELVKRKYPSAAPTVDYLASRPDRQSVRQDLQEDLAKTAAAQDAELLTQAQALLQAVEAKAPEAAATIGVSLENIKGASLELSKILAQGSGQGSTTGVSLKDADIQGDIKISDVTATHISGNPQGPIFTGPVGHAGDRNINTGGGSYVEGGVNTGGGDFVGRDKVDNRGGFNQPNWQVGTVNQGSGAVHHTSVGGDQLNTGDISGTGIAIGRGAQAHVTQGANAADLASLFAHIYTQIQNRPADPDVDRDEIVDTVQKIEAEAGKGEQANPTRVERWLRTLKEIAPDVLEVTAQALTNPVGGVAEGIRKVAVHLRRLSP